MREFTSVDNSFKILLGANAKENHELVDLASPEDVWFHLVDAPSPHLVIFCGGSSISRQEIKQCGQLVKQYSKSRNCRRVQVEYIQRKFISKAKTAGMVILNEKPTIVTIHQGRG